MAFGRQLFFVVVWLGMHASMSAQARRLQVTDCRLTPLLEAPLLGEVCVTRTPGSTNPDVLYYFHGMGADANTWSIAGEDLYHHWELLGKEPPTVVTMSFGYYWVLSERGPSIRSGLLEYVTERLMPDVEKRLGGLRGRRLLLGHSMGGFNVSQLVLKRGAMFERAVLACPGLFTLSPAASADEIDEYVRRTGAVDALVWMAILHWRLDFPTEREWQKSAPVELARKNLSQRSPKMLMWCGSHDQFGLYEGSTLFMEAANKNGAPLRWIPIPDGNHCDPSPTFEMAEFLVAR